MTRLNENKPLFTRKTLVLALAAANLLPGAARAADESFAISDAAPKAAAQDERVRELTQTPSTIEVGIGHVDRDSFKFGDYTGLNDRGGYLIGDVDIHKRPPADSGSASYWSLTGRNLGLTSRNLKFEGGNQGSYKFSFEYDELPKLQTDNYTTIYNGAGGANLTRPSPWTATASTATMTDLGRSLHPFGIESERKNLRLGFDKVLDNGWEVGAKYRRETKEGTKLIGAVSSATNTVLIPEPIDYTTDQFEATIAYASKKAQFQAGYYLSLFDNGNKALDWENPFSTGSLRNRMGLPPDSQFHQLNFSGGYNFTSATRLTAAASFGRMTQNDPFLGISVNNLAAVLPRSSLQGVVETTNLNLGLSSRPIPKLALNANLRYYDRDNKTPQDAFRYVTRDAAAGLAPCAALDANNQPLVTTACARVNQPRSHQVTNLKLDAVYEVLRATKLTVGYDYEEIKHKFFEFDKTREDTFRAELRRGMSESLTGGVSLANSHRRGGDYVFNFPFITGQTPQFLATGAATLDNNPALRKFFEANRNRDKVRAFASYAPAESATLQFTIDYIRDGYPDAVLGLQQNKGQVYTVDGNFAPSDNLTLSAFYSYEDSRSDQAGRQWSGAATGANPTLNDTNRNWFTNTAFKTETVGLGLRFAPQEKLDLAAEYLYSRFVGGIMVTAAPAFTATTGSPAPTPFPDLVTELNSLQLSATYKLKKDMSIRGGYLFQKLKTVNWAYDGVTPTTVASALITEQNPNYVVHVIGVSVIYKYW